MGDILKILTCFITVFIVSLFNACTERERTNPFDPESKIYGEDPFNLRVFSDFEAVHLLWDRLKSPEVIGYKIYRGINGREFELFKIVSEKSSRFDDANVDYDTLYQYYITAAAPEFETFPSSTVKITPGPTFIWVLDGYMDVLYVLTHDGAHIYNKLDYFGFPLDFDVNSREGAAYVIEWYTKSIIKVFRDGDVNYFEYTFKDPRSIAVNGNFGEVWVAESSEGRVLKLDTQGGKLGEFRLTGVPDVLVVSESTGDCWVMDKENNRIFIIKPVENDYVVITVEEKFGELKGLKFSNPENLCLVYDAGREMIYKIDRNGLLSDSLEWKNLLLFDIDQNTGDIWGLERNSRETGFNLVKLSRDGVRQLEKEGISSFPSSLYVSKYNGNLMIGERIRGGLKKFSAGGELISSFSQISDPVLIREEYFKAEY